MLISQAYLIEQRRLHDLGGYGIHGERWGHDALLLVAKTGARDVLDYGCGSGALGRHLTECGVDCRDYDPAIAGKDAEPEPADLVACADVLEHIEPEHIDAVGWHLRSLARKALFVAISTRPAGKTLSDGRNAHLLIESDGWWMEFFIDHGFRIKAVMPNSVGEWVAFMRPKGEAA